MKSWEHETVDKLLRSLPPREVIDNDNRLNGIVTKLDLVDHWTGSVEAGA